MKRFGSTACAMVLLAVLLLCCVPAGADASAGNMLRFDDSAERVIALGEALYARAAEDSDDLNRLDTFPVLPASLMRLADEYSGQTSVLEYTEYGILWHTEAAKVIYDERLMGVQVWAESADGGSRLDVDVDNIDGRDGVISIWLPEGYAAGNITSLHILYSASWISGWGNARLELVYDVSGGKAVPRYAEAIMEYAGYCMVWWLSKSDENGHMLLSLFSEYLANDSSWSGTLDLTDGKRIINEW